MAFVERLTKFAILIWLATLVAILLVSISWHRAEALPEGSDAIVCLGNAMLSGDSPLPAPRSARRAETCAMLQREGVAPVVIFTGSGNSVASTADAMANHASDLGLPMSAAIIEPRARSTIQNAAFSRQLLPEGAERVVLVSDAYHLPRSWVIFRALGYSDVALVATERAQSENGFAGVVEHSRRLFRESIVIWINVGRAFKYLAAGLFGVEEEVRIGWFN